MRAFTVYQPYAYAIVAGLKGYETRPTRTNIRGRVAVHAGKQKIALADMSVVLVPREGQADGGVSGLDRFGQGEGGGRTWRD